jgi:hypothetical protein
VEGGDKRIGQNPEKQGAGIRKLDDMRANSKPEVLAGRSIAHVLTP